MLRTTKVLMLVTDLGFVAYFTVTGLGLIPPEWAFADYDDPLMAAWNWSFLWIDLLASATGLTSLYLLRCGRAGEPLMLVSLVLTMASGLRQINKIVYLLSPDALVHLRTPSHARWHAQTHHGAGGVRPGSRGVFRWRRPTPGPADAR